MSMLENLRKGLNTPIAKIKIRKNDGVELDREKQERLSDAESLRRAERFAAERRANRESVQAFPLRDLATLVDVDLNALDDDFEKRTATLGEDGDIAATNEVKEPLEQEKEKRKKWRLPSFGRKGKVNSGEPQKPSMRINLLGDRKDGKAEEKVESRKIETTNLIEGALEDEEALKSGKAKLIPSKEEVARKPLMDLFPPEPTTPLETEIKPEAKTFSTPKVEESNEKAGVGEHASLRAEAERQRTIAMLRETIAKAQRTLEENEKTEKAILKRLEEIRGETTGIPAAESENGSEETSADMETKIDSLNAELDGLRKKIREKIDDLNRAGLFARTKSIREEIDTLEELYRKKGAEMDKLANRIGGVYAREQEEAERRRETERLERERKEIEERRGAIEEDKKINPFKYFLIDKMSNTVFRLLFGKEKGEAPLEKLNRILGESGKEMTVWDFQTILPMNFNTVHFSSNGFTLQLQNVDEVRGEKGIKTQDPKAKYKLVSPDWKCYENETALSYEDGVRLMEQRAQEYQVQQIAEFESRNSAN